MIGFSSTTLYSNSVPGTEKAARAGTLRLYFGVGAVLLLFLAPALLTYKSRNPEVLARYSASYAGVLCLYVLAVISCSVATVLPRPLLLRGRQRLQEWASSWLRGPALMAGAVLLPWVVFLTLATRFAQVELGRDVFLYACGAAATFWFSLGPVFVARKGTQARARALANKRRTPRGSAPGSCPS